jgi:hypothetical protein
MRLAQWNETKRSVVGGVDQQGIGFESESGIFVWCIRVFFILSGWNSFCNRGMDRSRRGAVECV